MSISANEFIQENDDDAGSDSESNSDDALDNHYQPISAQDFNDEHPDDYSAHYHHIVESNGSARTLENPSNGHIEEEGRGVSSLNLSDDDCEEEDRAVLEAISRAFTEDDRRRSAPLTPEAATRIRDAMRGVSFGGTTPDWAHSVPEDRWIDQLRRLRTPN
ncbi:hypothetical protein Syun_000180 [Stephania yunnanensis]|uniref:Male-enhanced antigen 1 n=1 Tax=Stephania yunnanensis TaxID=152371 RepID=A0AAP0Q5B5_9MAGN